MDFFLVIVSVVKISFHFDHDWVDLVPHLFFLLGSLFGFRFLRSLYLFIFASQVRNELVIRGQFTMAR